MLDKKLWDRRNAWKELEETWSKDKVVNITRIRGNTDVRVTRQGLKIIVTNMSSFFKSSVKGGQQQ